MIDQSDQSNDRWIETTDRIESNRIENWNDGYPMEITDPIETRGWNRRWKWGLWWWWWRWWRWWWWMDESCQQQQQTQTLSKPSHTWSFPCSNWAVVETSERRQNDWRRRIDVNSEMMNADNNNNTPMFYCIDKSSNNNSNNKVNTPICLLLTTTAEASLMCSLFSLFLTTLTIHLYTLK